MKKIPLSKSKFAVVDDEFYEELIRHKWHAQITFGIEYAVSKNGLLMHRLIMSAPTGIMVDHINGIGTDNRKQNLRLATNSQNQANSNLKKKSISGYRGVHWYGSKNKWAVRIGKRGDFFGFFSDKVEAAKRYNIEAVKKYGDFAKLNTI